MSVKILSSILLIYLGLSSSFLEALHLETIVSFTSSFSGSPSLGTGYGGIVRFNDDWMFVSSPLARPNQKIMAGAVYIYKKTDQGYQEKQIIIPPEGLDHLGLSQIESDRDWLLISLMGTPDDVLSIPDFTGSIQIYHLENEQWVFHSALDRNTPGLEELSKAQLAALSSTVFPFLHEQGAHFGFIFSLNWEHRVLLVGAPYQAVLSPSLFPLINVGCVYAFYFNKETSHWEYLQKIINPEGYLTNDAFGATVVTDGSYALIGNAPVLPFPKSNGFESCLTFLDLNSAVYVYRRTPCNRWEWIQKIKGDQMNSTPIVLNVGGSSLLTTGDCFGATLALKNGHAIIGAPQENLGSATICGAAYFYEQNADGLLKRVFKATSSDPFSQRFAFPTIRIHHDKAYISDINFSGNHKSQGAIAVYSFKEREKSKEERLLERRHHWQRQNISKRKKRKRKSGRQGKWISKGNLVNPDSSPFEFFGESFDIKGKILGVGMGLFSGGFASAVSGSTPLVEVPQPYPEEKSCFTLFKVKS